MNEYKAINQGDEPMRVYVKYESSNFLYPEDMKKFSPICGITVNFAYLELKWNACTASFQEPAALAG